MLTQDDDFLNDVAIEETGGVLYQTDQTLSARAVGDVVHELSQYREQSEIDLESVSQNWL